MRCEILLFAQLTEVVGADRLTMEIDEGSTVGDLLEKLCARHEGIAAIRDQVAVAVDERYCAPDTPLLPGQVLALIPPVSGG